MKAILKNVVTVSVPTVLLASAVPVSADEIQSIAAQVLAQQAAKPALSPAPPPPLILSVHGTRL